MIILALDLTSAFGSVVLRADGRVRASLDLDSQDGFAHLIFPAIEEVLKSAGVRGGQVECFASANGPGAFTGVRVGLSVVKGLAEAFGRAAAGVSTLRALSTFGTGPQRAAVMDARRGDIFGAVFDASGEVIEQETVMRLPAWIETLPRPLPEFVVQDASMISNAAIGDAPVVVAPRRLAGAVALCAERDGEHGLWVDPAVLDANYVRRSDAELFWREQ